LNTSDYWLFGGGDPAVFGDYFGICIHALPKKRPKDKPWLPFLIKLTKMQGKSYKMIWDELQTGTMERYKHFKRFNFDYTNEKTLTDFLESKFGDRRIKKTPFTKGESGTKMQMAQSAKKFLDSGYTFPDHNQIEDPVERDNIRTLKTQIINEQVVLNTDGSIKFQHKGKHNDLLHAWMLSLDITMEYILERQGMKGIHIGGSISNGKNSTRSEWGHQQDIGDIFSNY